MHTDILLGEARYTPPRLGDVGLVSAVWVERQTLELGPGVTLLVCTPQGIVLPIIDRTLPPYETCQHIPLTVLEALVAALTDAPEGTEDTC